MMHGQLNIYLKKKYYLEIALQHVTVQKIIIFEDCTTAFVYMTLQQIYHLNRCAVPTEAIIENTIF